MRFTAPALERRDFPGSQIQYIRFSTVKSMKKWLDTTRWSGVELQMKATDKVVRILSGERDKILFVFGDSGAKRFFQP
jgi:hypothetical protein